MAFAAADMGVEAGTAGFRAVRIDPDLLLDKRERPGQVRF